MCQKHSQETEKTHRMREKISNHISDKCLLSRTYKELLWLNDKMINNNLKMGKGSE